MKITKKESCQAASDGVVDAMEKLLLSYKDFRTETGLVKNQLGGFEICTSIMDKAGRIARQIKHLERKDPKPDWSNAISEDIFGCVAYLMMLVYKYDLPMEDNVRKELEKALSQHSK